MDSETLLNALPALHARARRLTGTRAEAEDLLHTALLGLFEQTNRGRRIDAPVRYVMASLRHARLAYVRRAARETSLDHAPEQQTGDAFVGCLYSETLRAIDRLPPTDRLLLRLVATGETSPADLARRLSLPKGTVMSRLARARSRLRAALGEGATMP